MRPSHHQRPSPFFMTLAALLFTAFVTLGGAHHPAAAEEGIGLHGLTTPDQHATEMRSAASLFAVRHQNAGAAERAEGGAEPDSPTGEGGTDGLLSTGMTATLLTAARESTPGVGARRLHVGALSHRPGPRAPPLS